MKNTENEESASITSKKGRFAILGVILLGLAKFGEDGLRLLSRAYHEESFMAKGVEEVTKYGIGEGIKRYTTTEDDLAVNNVDSTKVDSTASKSGR